MHGPSSEHSADPSKGSAQQDPSPSLFRKAAPDTLHVVPDPIFWVSKDGVFLDFIPARGFETYAAPGDFLGRSIREVMPPEVAEVSKRCIEQAIDTGEIQTFEYTLLLGGTRRHFEARVLPDAQRENVLAVVRDITERKQAEAKLQQAERRYRDLFEEAPVMYLITDSHEDGPRIIDCNGRFLDALGYGREEVVGHPLTDFYTAGSSAELLEGGGYRRALAGAFSAEERQLLARDGRVVEALLRAMPERDAQGRVIGTRAMYVDISERKQMEQALRESEERWRSLVELHPEPIMVRVEDKIVYLNTAGVRMLGGASAEALHGTSYLSFVAPEFQEALRTRHEALRRGEAAPSMEYRIIGLDGRERFVESSTVLVLYQGEPAFQTVMRDTTERRRYERELIEAREQAVEMARLKSTFLANMSHEIRTPLTSIIGFADILAEEATEENREFARLIRQSGERLMQTLNSVLDLVQLEGGTLRLAAERVDVAGLAQQVLDLFRVQILHRDLELKLAASRQPLFVRLDAGALSRVLTNLVSNAVKFTDAGYVQVVVEDAADMLELRVEDTGIGIGADFLPRLFGEFYQESSGLTRGYAGSGLGLAITKRLVALMDGTIHVASEKGRGTVITVRLPKDPGGKRKT